MMARYHDMTYRERVRGCWLGKCLGGGMGMAHEGVPYVPQVREEELRLQDVPNDDMEMQLIWLRALETYGLALDSRRMGQVWMDHIPHGLDEYAVAQRNLRRGIMPPYSGRKDNPFADGMGATIRSEIWAAVFAGNPRAAMHFAEIDASVDHWGDGVWGEIFMAALQCQVFQLRNLEEALRFALAQVPLESRLGRTVGRVLRLHEDGVTEDEAKRIILREYRQPNFTDCVMNLASIVYALLWGSGDFVKSVLMAVNMGRDTDCTAASVGATLGIMGAIPPAYEQRVADRLTVSPYIEEVPGVELSLKGLVERTVSAHEALSSACTENYGPYVPCELPADTPSLDRSTWLVIPVEPSNEALVQALAEGGAVPEEASRYRVSFEDLMLDLSPWADHGNTLELFTYLTIDSPLKAAVLSMTADTGLTLWVDGQRLLNHHSRQAAIPSFHRAEGGAAFLWPVPEARHVLVRIRLLSCMKPLRCCLMFGNLDNDHLDGFTFDI